MVVIWICTYTFMPPFIVLAERLTTKNGVARGWRAGYSRSSSLFARFIVRRAGLMAAFAGLVTIGSSLLVARFARDPIQYDFAKLGSRQGKIDGAAYFGAHLEAVMQSYLTPTVILTEDAATANRIADAIREEKQKEGKGSLIDRITTSADLLPEHQPEKLALLTEIFRLIDENPVLEKLSAEDRPLIEKLRQRTELRAVTLDDVPARITRIFREKDGTVGRLVLVYPTLGATAEHGRQALSFADTIRRVTRNVAPSARVAGNLILSADIIESITHDGAKAAILSFLMVALLTIIVLGRFSDAVWVLGSLTVGTLWMGGAFGALDLKLNFVNFVVLPITFGIGVDYAANLYGRYREAPTPEMAEALAASAGAVALCSATTIIGYATLLVADNRAIFSFGLAAVLGELACLSTALVALPAVLFVVSRRRSEKS
jgi:predicted RND superfamily exporter protein